MRHTMVRISLAATLMLTLALPPAFAHATSLPPDRPIEAGDAPGGGFETATGWGALAGVGCGFFIRATVATGGAAVGTIVGAVACCAYMIFDALVVEGAKP